VIRTIFLLNYVNDVELRRSIHAATSKSEDFNNSVKWLFEGAFAVLYVPIGLTICAGIN
jgi:TnpA family transposase